MMAPKIGPVPAILRNCIIKTFQVGMTMKSTPSAFSTAGVGRFGSGPNTLAMNFPYTKYPSTRAKTLKRNEYIVR